MSPSNLRSRPPATPVRGAEVYLASDSCKEGSDEVDELVLMFVEDVLRVNGDAMAVDRRKGLEEAVTDEPGAGDVADLEICRCGRDGGPTDVGLPPGVRDRVTEMPFPLRPSID